jgi:transcriptional regulator with XRE-family HTH domain
MARRGISGPPASYLVAGEWPDGEVQGPQAARVAQQLAINLHAAMAGRGLREVARAAGMNHAALRAVMRGESWPDLITIARLEAALEVDLWPGRGGQE